MQSDKFVKLFTQKPFVLDGASGTRLLEMGMPAGVCPERWAYDHIHVMEELYSSYIEAGAQCIYTFTFGANRYKLAQYGREEEMHEINVGICKAAKQIAQGRALVAGDLSPIGEFVQPFGDVLFADAVQVYQEQAAALAEGGADFLIIETMMDIQNARAALLGAKKACDLPVVVTLTFDESGHTLTGTNAKTAATTLCSLGADGIGANCGVGPEAMYSVIEQLHEYSSVPVFAKPNAGLPTGEDMPVEQYAQAVARLIDAGASAVGGCCGTSYEHIHRIRQLTENRQIKPWGRGYSPSRLSSLSATTHIQPGAMSTIGERINPTGKKSMQQALKEQDMDYMIRMASEQRDAGAQLLDINVGMADIDELQMLCEVTLAVSARVATPLCIDSANISAIEAALRVYPGRALLNSVSAEKGRGEQLFPLIQTYGCMYVALPIGDGGIPQTADERIRVIEALLRQADEYGIPRSHAVVDVLAMAIGSDADAGHVALEVVDWCRSQRLHCMMGVSNVSFGLPERPAVNTAMLIAAMARGMNVSIVNVCDDELRATLEAARAVVYGEDIQSYAALFTPESKETGLVGVVVQGQKEKVPDQIEALLAKGDTPQTIVDEYLIAALDKVGDLFSQKKLFLPQLMASAEAAKVGFSILEPQMMKEGERKKATAVMATVEGDIHDIGKNIVALMLRNHGFHVIDLGKDVSNEEILRVAQQEQADIIGLSALITTTMPRMGECAQLIRERGIQSTLMVGGAVVTKEYARQIGALYSKDAAEAVEVAKGVLKQRKR